MSSITLSDARRLLGDRLVDPAALGELLGGPAAPLDDGAPVPFARDELGAAAASGCWLVRRPASLADGRPVTLAALLERVGSGGPGGFRGDDPWFAERPFAAQEAVEPGWALFHAEPLRETLNRTYDAAEAALRGRAGALPWRRRRAAEIAFDCFAVAAARGVRLLERTWDWSSTAAEDGGLINVGGFGASGLEVLSYSRAVKHGALGVCPTLVRGIES